MHDLIKIGTIELQSFLAKELPKITDGWWKQCVINKLSFQQQNIAQERKLDSLDKLDFAALLRIFDQNWFELSHKVDLPREARSWLKELQSVRNKWAHLSRDLPVNEVYRDMDTLLRVLNIIDASEDSLLTINTKIKNILAELSNDQADDETIDVKVNEHKLTKNSGKFTVGEIVCLTSDNNEIFPVIEVITGDTETRYKVFHNNKMATYYESQLSAAHSDYVLNRVNAAREMRRFIDGENLWFYIKDFLNRKYKGSYILQLQDSVLTAEIQLSKEAIVDFQYYLEKNKALSRTQLAVGDRKQCVFTNKTDLRNHKYEVINQYHPLVRFISNKISHETFHQLVSGEISQQHIPKVKKGYYLIVCELWSTSGAKTVEKLVYKGFALDTLEFINDEYAETIISSAITYAKEWAGAKSYMSGDKISNYFDELKDKVDEEFSEYAEYMKLENNDQVDYLIEAMERKITSQVATIQDVITSFRARNKLRLIPANEGKIKKLKDKLETKTGVYEQQRNINTDHDSVIVGVINVS